MQGQVKKENIKILTMVYLIFFFIHWIDMCSRPILQKCLQQKPSKVYCQDTARQNFNHTKKHGQDNNVHLIHSWKFPRSLSSSVPKANYLWAQKSACHSLRAACYNLSGKADFRIHAVGSLMCFNILYIRL